MGQPGWEGLWGRIDTCIYIPGSLWCSPETTIILLSSYVHVLVISDFLWPPIQKYLWCFFFCCFVLKDRGHRGGTAERGNVDKDMIELKVLIDLPFYARDRDRTIIIVTFKIKVRVILVVIWDLIDYTICMECIF